MPVVMVVQNQGVPQDVRVASFGRTLARAGYAVEIIAPARRGQAAEEVIDGYAVHRFPQPPDGAGVIGYGWEAVVSLWHIVRARSRLQVGAPWRILHICNPPDVLWAPFVTSSSQMIRIYDHHDLAPELYLAKGGRPGSAAHRDESLREWADFVVCYVGSIGSQDGVEELIRAMSSVRKTDVSRKYLCLVVGSGAALAGSQELASSLGLTDTVRFLGWVGDASRVRDIIASSDLGVEPCPSNAFNDSSTMIKLTEYLAAGRPVLAYDLPEHRVTAGDAGLFVSPSLGYKGLARAIVELARDRPKLKALGDKATRRLTEAGLSDTNAEQALLRIYDQATALAQSRGASW